MTDKDSSWPLGRLPKEWRRTEPDQIREAGYTWEDAREIVDIFEKKVATFAGSRFGVAIDTCSNGLFLCMKYLECSGEISIPKQTYVSVPQQIIHAGCKPKFEDLEWTGAYQLKPYPIIDAALRWRRGMYAEEPQDSMMVLSFQLKKRVPIGKGGMILLNDEKAYKWLKKARHDGREIDGPIAEDPFDVLGYHMYMTPEDAARGILLMDQVPEINQDAGGHVDYRDLSEVKTLTGC